MIRCGQAFLHCFMAAKPALVNEYPPLNSSCTTKPLSLNWRSAGLCLVSCGPLKHNICPGETRYCRKITRTRRSGVDNIFFSRSHLRFDFHTESVAEQQLMRAAGQWREAAAIDRIQRISLPDRTLSYDYQRSPQYIRSRHARPVGGRHPVSRRLEVPRATAMIRGSRRFVTSREFDTCLNASQPLFPSRRTLRCRAFHQVPVSARVAICSLSFVWADAVSRQMAWRHVGSCIVCFKERRNATR